MMRCGNWFKRMLQVAACCLASAGFMQTAAGYIGPAVVAKADRHLWSGPVNTVAGFDRASRASILVYVLALQEQGKLSDDEMLSAFRIKSINRASVEKWLKKESSLSLLNYQHAAKDCSAGDWTCAKEVNTFEGLLKKAEEASHKAPANLQAWWKNLAAFSHAYVAEQLRLAALFPRVSSEIDLFNDNEWNGDALPDRQFFLTFDDGPTAAGGNSDETLQMMAAEKKSAVFFVLGEKFQDRLNKTGSPALTRLYSKQCVASHGWQHKSHAKWEQWQDSIKRTSALLRATLPGDNVVPLFRPPYGQRKDDSGQFFRSQSLQVALWNLDSQDWNHHVNVDDIVNRMIVLMLIKRHGVLLFHDVHPKAKTALPEMFKELGDAVSWGDCHGLAAAQREH